MFREAPRLNWILKFQANHFNRSLKAIVDKYLNISDPFEKIEKVLEFPDT